MQTIAKFHVLASWLTCTSTEQLVIEASPVKEQKRWFCDVTVFPLLLKISARSGV